MALVSPNQLPSYFLREIILFKTTIQDLDPVECSNILPLLSELFTCPNDKELLQIPKKIISILKSSNDFKSAPALTTVKILVGIYIRYPCRHPLKSVFRSLFQGLPSANQEYVVTYLETEINHLVKRPWHNNDDQLKHLRAVVETILSLLENFPLGEETLKRHCIPVLSFLAQCLQEFLATFSSPHLPPIQCNEIMHHCLATSKTANKILQKFSAVFIDAIHSISAEVDSISEQLALSASQLVQEEKMLIDCQTNGGMTLILLLQLWDKEKGSLLLSPLFSDKIPSSQESESPNWLRKVEMSDINLTKLPASSSLSLMFAMLALMSPGKLAQPYLENCAAIDCSFFNAILKQLFTSIARSENAGSKLLGCRSLVLWTSKMSMALKIKEIEKDYIASLTEDQGLLSHILDYIWTAWEDHSDAVRLNARNIFQNVIMVYQQATVICNSGNNMEFICQLTSRLLHSISWSSKGKYGALCCLVDHLGTGTVLSLEPAIAVTILQQMREHQLASYASELYEKLLQKHKQELWVCHCIECDSTLENVTVGKNTVLELCCSQRQSWCQQWLQPVAHLLCTESIDSSLNIHITEYVIPKLMKSSRHVLEFMIHTIWPTRNNIKGENSKQFKNLGALLTCLRRAKSIGILYQLSKSEGLKDNQDWNGVIPFTVLNHALTHINNQIRLDGYALLCENIKMTEPLTQDELPLLMMFVRDNINNQVPAFRQQLVSHTKKLFVRMKESCRALKRQHKKPNNQKEENMSSKICSYSNYLVFLSDMMALLLESILPGTPFACRTTALNIISLMVDIFKLDDSDTCDSIGLFPMSAMTEPVQLTLLQCVTDTFEENKMAAFKIITSLPTHKLTILQNDLYQRELLAVAMCLCVSTKPQDCTTAAYLLRLLLCQENISKALSDYKPLLLVASKVTFGQPDSEPQPANTKTNNCLYLVQLLIVLLKDQVQVAQDSLVHAAANRPMYPTIHCIRYIIAHLDLRSQTEVSSWREVFKLLIDVCLEVATIVSPVVHNSSPEGNIPEDAIMGPGLNVGALVCCEGDQEALQNAIFQSNELVTLMPEYLVVCCWRSIKEVSLLLGQLCQEVPVGVEDQSALISVGQVISIGDYFTTQLLESRHRGAFELAYAGFVKMCDMLWKSSIPVLHKLPCQWLDDIMAGIGGGDTSSQLCATRRSAGVPFYIQAIVSTEPVSIGRVNFKRTMSRLLELATCQLPGNSKQSTDSKVHALNVLRSLYRDTRLGEDVAPYIADGLKAAILGFSSHLWAVTNSATLLLSSLMTRIFGVNRSKLEKNVSRKNCQTGRTFFTHYPTLYQFLLEQIDKASPNIGKSSLSMNPTLYPVLLVLGRLYPSSLDGIDMGLNLDAFIPYVIRCAASPILKTREMAAKALQPLVAKGQLTHTVNKLLLYIPTDTSHQISQNFLHGLLLQIQQLVLLLPTLPQSHQENIARDVLEVFSIRLWLLSSPSVCLIIRQVALEVATSLSSQNWTLDKDNPDHLLIVSTLFNLCNTEYENLSFPSSLWPPGQSQYLVTICKVHLWRIEQSQVPGNFPSLTNMLLKYLKSTFYEIRLEVLSWIEKIFAKGHLKDCCDSEQKTSESCQCFTSFLGGSTEIVTLLLDYIHTEQHSQCLAKVFCVLTCHPISNQISLMEAPKALKITHHIMNLLEQDQREEVQESAILFSGLLLPLIYHQDPTTATLSLFERWCTMLTNCSSTEQSANLQLACTHFLLMNTTILFRDPAQVFGRLKFFFWEILINLLQEDDMEVKDMAADILDKLHTSNAVSVHPALAIHHLLKDLLLQKGVIEDISPILTVISWMHQTPKSCTEMEERLFDRGEMNTYRNEVGFLQIVASYLDIVLSNGSTTDPQQPSDESLVNNTDLTYIPQHFSSKQKTYLLCLDESTEKKASYKLIKEEFIVTLKLLISRLSQVKPQTMTSVFSDVATHQADCVDMYKLLLSLLYLQRLLLKTSLREANNHGDLTELFNIVREQMNQIFGHFTYVTNNLLSKCQSTFNQISLYWPTSH